MHHDHVDVETDQLSGETWEPFELPLRAPDLEGQVLPFDIPQLLQPLREGSEDQRATGIREEDADPKDFPRLLCIGLEWRHEEAQGERHDALNGPIPYGGVLQHTRAPSQERFHDVSRRQTTGSDGWTCYIGDVRPALEENARGARDTKRQDLRLPRDSSL